MTKPSKNEYLILITICLITLVFLGFLTKFYSLCEAKNGVVIRDTLGMFRCLKKENINE